MSTRASVRQAGNSDEAGEELSYREAVRIALQDEMDLDPAVVLLGEDVGRAGGPFKTDEGLLDRFGPTRVIETPICENGFMGVALGLAATGLRPVVEISFSDFLPMGADALVNEIPKFRFMSGGQLSVPLTIRAIGGGTVRFGTQHSATGESWYMQDAGLRIAAASSPEMAYGLLRAAIRDDNPTLVFEHKALYGRKGPVDRTETVPAIGKARVVRSGRDLTMVATLLMVERAIQAAGQLALQGIEAEVIDLTWINPLDLPTIATSVDKTGRLIIVEEQYHAGGWGATLISRLTLEGIQWRVSPRAVSFPADVPIPFSPPLEDAVVPSVERIVAAARDAMEDHRTASTDVSAGQ